MQRLSNEIVDQFKKDYITSNNIGTVYLVLLALWNEDYDFLDHLDDENKDRKMILLYRDLVYKGYLVEYEDNPEYTNVHFGLTPKSVKLLTSVKEEPLKEFEKITIKTEEVLEQPIVVEPEEVKTPKSRKVDPKLEEIQSWIKDWITLFPKNRLDGYALRSGKGVTANKMKKFLDDNKQFDKDIVFKATQMYLNQQAQSGFKYTLLAGNFIMKSEGGPGSPKNSTLEMYCDLVVDDNTSSNINLVDDNPFA